MARWWPPPVTNLRPPPPCSPSMANSRSWFSWQTRCVLYRLPLHGASCTHVSLLCCAGEAQGCGSVQAEGQCALAIPCLKLAMCCLGARHFICVPHFFRSWHCSSRPSKIAWTSPKCRNGRSLALQVRFLPTKLLGDGNLLQSFAT